MKLQLLQPAVPPNRPLRPERGIALVITLSFLLITTVIIVAFLVRARFDYQASASYSAGVQSDLLAAGAMDQVVANFLEEIADPANSTKHENGDFTWFEPVAVGDKFTSMLPKLQTNYNDVRNNLVKQSIASLGASGINTANTNQERPVTAERWDLPNLLLDAAGEARESFANGTVPNWIYLKENGQITASPPTGNESLAGRFAYNVYDVGGLLNINVAGHESSAKEEDVAGKGALAFADLTQIPGLDTNAIDQIVKWRSPYVDWTNSGIPNTDIQNPSSLSVLDYLRVGSASGWMKNASITSDLPGNRFLSRRDLNKYLFDPATGIGEEKARAAAPFLTHFSVDLDAPTFSPDTTHLLLGRSRPGSDTSEPPRPFVTERKAYLVESESADPDLTDNDQPRINPSRYAPDTIIEALELPNGDTATVPGIPKRFPLSRLAMVATDNSERDAANSTPELTKKYFGLELENSFTWRYSDAEGETDEIKTLDEVAAQNREPNFFEILKSVIQMGSLGQFRNPIPKTSAVGGSLEPRANRIDEHIFRIGAAIIDQADADSYPTRIRFIYDPSTALGEIYGVEDLPYISHLRFVGYGKRTGSNNTPKRHWYIAQPTLWNPHNPNRGAVGSSGVPTNFQITTLKPPTVNSGMISILAGNATTAGQFPAGTSLTFNWNPSSPNFREPQGLLSSAYPVGAGLGGSAGTTFEISSEEDNLLLPLRPFSTAGNTTIGFLIAQHVDVDANSERISYTNGVAQFLLQYQAGGSYHTYDRIWFAPQQVKHEDHNAHAGQLYFTSIFSGREKPLDPPGQFLRTEAIYSKADPRSQRFIWPADIAAFTGPAPYNVRRYMWAEGTGMGWYGGLYSMLDWTTPSSGVAGMDQTKNYVDLWTFGKHRNSRANGSHDWGLREDLGYLSINSRKDFSSGLYYSDHDSVVRRAMAGAIDLDKLRAKFSLPPEVQSVGTANNPGPNGADDQFPMPLQSNALWTASGENVNKDFYEHRPVVLNRPFRSVGELAHAFRDVPWKNIDFSFQESGDTGLLDVFTIYESNGLSDSATPLVAGKVNLNSAPKPVLRSLLSRTASEVPTPASSTIGSDTQIPSADVVQLADRIAEYRSEFGSSPSEGTSGVNGPLRSLAELVGRVYSGSGGEFSDFASFVGLRPEQIGGGKNIVRQERLGTATRALADMGTTRTWNLMIDMVAQSGKLRENGALDDFNVSAESRWWLFVSIDRFTGKVLARSIERVVE